MKKLMFLMMALLVAPAMADVTISIEDNEDLTADIVMTATDDDADGASSLVAGIALDVSVANGVITGVTNFMADGVSTAATPGYGIFLGTITFTGGTPEAIDQVGTPVAPDTAPDSPGQLGTAAIVLEFGGLYDVGVPGDAPLAVTTLCTIAVSEPTDLTLGANATRGGVVIIGGGAPSSTNLSVSGPITDGDCYTGPDFNEWVTVGKPKSWCGDYQCHGDANDDVERVTRDWVRVGDVDINILVAGFNTLYSGSDKQDGPDDGNEPDTWISADFDHAQEQVTRDWVRVGDNDISVLLHFFNDKNVPPGDCQTANPITDPF